MNANERGRQAVEDSERWFPATAGVAYGPSEVGFTTLCLNGEAGEVANEIKKVIRGTHPLDREQMDKIIDEAIDVQTYLYKLMGEVDQMSRRVFAREIDWEHEYEKKRAFNEERFGKKNPFDPEVDPYISERWYPRD